MPIFVAGCKSACYFIARVNKNGNLTSCRFFILVILAGIIFAYICLKDGMKIIIEPDGCGTGDGGIKNLLNQILQNQITIMALIDDLKLQVTGLQTQVTDLQTSLDAEQQQIADLLATNAGVVTDLNNQITALNAQLADSANPTQLQEVIDGIATIRDSLATTKTDLEGTV